MDLIFFVPIFVANALFIYFLIILYIFYAHFILFSEFRKKAFLTSMLYFLLLFVCSSTLLKFQNFNETHRSILDISNINIFNDNHIPIFLPLHLIITLPQKIILLYLKWIFLNSILILSLIPEIIVLDIMTITVIRDLSRYWMTWASYLVLFIIL